MDKFCSLASSNFNRGNFAVLAFYWTYAENLGEINFGVLCNSFVVKIKKIRSQETGRRAYSLHNMCLLMILKFGSFLGNWIGLSDFKLSHVLRPEFVFIKESTCPLFSSRFHSPPINRVWKFRKLQLLHLRLKKNWENR